MLLSFCLQGFVLTELFSFFISHYLVFNFYLFYQVYDFYQTKTHIFLENLSFLNASIKWGYR
jgi:hypothetical protein